MGILTGKEVVQVIGLDNTGFPSGVTQSVTTAQLAGVASLDGIITTADNGTSQTLTGAMVTGANTTVHVSTGGATPTLTMPTLANILATGNTAVGDSYTLRIINTNSGTATMAINTGLASIATPTLATNTWRDYLITIVSSSSYTMVSIGAGTAP